VQAYTSLFSPRTKLVHITHLINLSGQLVPVAAIASKAKAAGIEVAVDSAHSVAHIAFTIPGLQADYVGASLHKWMCNPLGAGFLWMKKEHIGKIYPLMADEEFAKNDIRKFEHQGTRPVQTLETLKESIKFHNRIGSQLKQNRLRYLMRYWVDKVKDIDAIKINTPYENEDRHGAIANIAVKGFTPAQLTEKLLNDHKIFTVAIDHPAIKGVRITPHIYTTVEELDKLGYALKEIAK
jgi:selenocysteine lyase/cysteine desulfurase